jgi:predicted dehydrogenase
MKTSRREILKAAAAIATARFPIRGANDRINVGIVGLGGRGRDHIDYFSELKSDCRIAAVCDVEQAARERAVTLVRNAGGAPVDFADMRRMFESKDIDAVSIATPNHWHALATIWACQAGKDVFVEKPASHNIFEGNQMVTAARRYNRIVQVGMQNRSIRHYRRAAELLRGGAIGRVYGSRGLCFRRRLSIGHTPDVPVPAGLDWSAFLGPAQMKPYSRNKFAYTWHWFWDTGNGDIGNQGVHEMDVCLWGLNRAGWPNRISATGGKYVWQDDQETPNMQQSVFEFGDGELTFDVRNLPTPPEGLAGLRGPNYVGSIFFGDAGFMTLDQEGFIVYRSTAATQSGEASRGAASWGRERYEKTHQEAAAQEPDSVHVANFLAALRARDHRLLNADIEVGVRSAAFCHLANIAYRTGSPLAIDSASGEFAGVPEADRLRTRDYRSPYVVPDLGKA